MKMVLAYWIFGCVIAGLAMGSHWRKCPDDKRPVTEELLVVVTMWPAFLIGGLATPTGWTTPCVMQTN